MENLEQLKQELASLTERVNALNSNSNSITLTRDQLMRLIDIVKGETTEYIKGEVEDAGLDIDNYVELELCGREIEVITDNSQLIRDIKDNIGGPEPIKEEHIDDLLKQVKQAN